MPSHTSLSLADLVQTTLPSGWEARVPDDGGRQDRAQAAPRDHEDLRDVSAELSQLLAELARTPAVDVDVAAGWTPDLKAGDVVADRFELRRELGRGGFGVVFEALDRELGREVAFKAVLPGRRVASRSQEWVRREAEAVACLNHPNIVTLHDFGRAPTGPYLIFELLRGETLAQRLKRGPLPPREALSLAAHVSRVLDHAHRAGVVHRDLKPGNVFLCQHGAVKVLDFGLAHLFGRAGPVSGGTPAYMSPEQWRSEAGDERTDVFALGVLLHEMLAGAVPYPVTRDGSRERSPVQGPGSPPEVPAGAAPPAVRRLVRRMLEKDPASRPQRAAEVLSELERAQRGMDGKARRWIVGAAGGVAAAVVAAAVAIAIRGAPPPPAPVLVAVADFENETGERELDALSGLLVTSLEQSRRFQVLTRGRLRAGLRELGRTDAPRIDEAIARELARSAGAQFVLAGSARRAGGSIALEVRLVDPKDGRSQDPITEHADEDGDVLGAIDRLSDGARKALQEREEDVRGSRIQVARAVTSSLEAYRAYFEGVECADRPTRAGSWVSVAPCADHFRAALALDPTFAMAHYQIAFLLGAETGPRPELEAHMAAALRYVDRVPPKEAALIRAWDAHLGGRDEEALSLYGQVLAGFPDDLEALMLAGDLEFHRGEWVAAVPFFEKVLALDPEAEWPLAHLVDALGVLRRPAELRALVGRLEGVAPSAARAHATVRALGWAGDAPGAVAAARAASERFPGPAASHDLATALAAEGRYAEAEAVLRRSVAEDPADAPARGALAGALRAQGRAAEGLAVLDAGPGRSDDAFVRAAYLAGGGDARAVWREAAKAAATSARPEQVGFLAVLLALAGDAEHAAQLGARVPAGSAAAEQLEAIRAWRSGDGAGAVARLATLESRDPWPTYALPPAYLIAEIAADSGDPREAVRASTRYLALWPRGIWRGWAYPRALFLSARARAELGEVPAAREELRRLLALLGSADRGEPLLPAARALAAKLGR
jgi:tetratricopeptide (TPR) repeat protein/TolB-like protein